MLPAKTESPGVMKLSILTEFQIGFTPKVFIKIGLGNKFLFFGSTSVLGRCRKVQGIRKCIC
jgi:hypothetical protein